ncbi:hypothetical protein Tco_0255034, partial [Tanacetum coccineum]
MSSNIVLSPPLWTSSSSSSSDGEIIDKSKCVLDNIIRQRHMSVFREFNHIVSEFESYSITFLKRADKFRNDVCLLFDGIRKYVVKNSVSNQRLKRVSEYVTRVKEMIILRRLHDTRTDSELAELDFNVKQLDEVTVDNWRSRIREASASRWGVIVEEQRLVRSHLQDPPKDDTSSSSSMADENDLGPARRSACSRITAQESSCVVRVDHQNEVAEESSSVGFVDDVLVNNPGLEPVDATLSTSSMADENDLGFADEVDQESTLPDGASSSVLDDIAAINQNLQQLNDLLNQHAPPEEFAHESPSSLLDGDSRSALDNLALIKRELQQCNDLLHQALPQKEIVQESSNSESVDDSYDAVVNNSGLQQVDDHEMQSIESVIADENVAVNNVGLEQGADHTEILLTEQGPPEDQLVQESSSSFTLTDGSQNNATNEYDVLTNNQGLQQGDDKIEIAQESSTVALVDDQNGDAPESSSVSRVHGQNEVTQESPAVGFVDYQKEVAQGSSSVGIGPVNDKDGVAQELSCVKRLDDQNEVAEESSSVGVVDVVLVNNPGLQPVDAQEDEPPEEGDLAEVWRRKVGVVGIHGDGSRFSVGEYFSLRLWRLKMKFQFEPNGYQKAQNSMYILHKLLPFLKSVDEEQRTEMEIEARMNVNSETSRQVVSYATDGWRRIPVAHDGPGQEPV